MPRTRTVGGLFDGSAMPLGLPGCVLGLAILLLVVSGGHQARADLVITTTPGDGGTLDFGPTLVGSTSSQILTALSDPNAGSDGGGQGFFGGATDLSANASTVFGSTTSSQFNLGFAGDSANSTYTYSPLVRGIDQGQVQVSYGSNGQAADGNVAATITLTGQGVAPVVATDQSKNDAGFVLVGQTGTASVSVQNTGDGNKSGLGAVSNLQGSISSGAGAFTLQGGSSLGGGNGLGDGASQTFNYTFKPTERGSSTQGVSVSLSNGSTDGTNQANTQNFQVSGTGVAPVSTAFDQSKSNAGYTLVGTSNTASVSVTNMGDGNKSGLGAASNLNGGVQAGAGAFALNGGSTLSLKDGQTGTFTYDFKPTERGASTQTMTASFSNGSSDGTNSAHTRTYQVSGTGVAPVSAGVSNGNAGYTLVGTSKDATVSVTNIGDGNKSGLGAISNLNGNVAGGSGNVSASVGGFALQGSSAVSLGDGKTGTFAYTFTPTQRGSAQVSLTANFSNGSADGTNSAHAENYVVQGQGVAPVNSYSQANAGLTRIGTTNTASLAITNVGDGNKSGLGAISNLNGSAGAVSGQFTGSGGSFSIGDSGRQTFGYQYTPTSHGMNKANVSLNFANGSSDGRNASEAHDLVLSGQGVGPTFASSSAPGSLLDFGAINPGETGSLPLSIRNSSTDPNGGNQSLTDLTLLRYSFAGSDASLFSLTNFTAGRVLHEGDELGLLINLNTDEDTAEGWKYADLTFVTDEGAALGMAGAQFTFHLKGYVNPEPSSLTLLGTGVVCLAGYGWRRRRRTTA